MKPVSMQDTSAISEITPEILHSQEIQILPALLLISILNVLYYYFTIDPTELRGGSPTGHISPSGDSSLRPNRCEAGALSTRPPKLVTLYIHSHLACKLSNCSE